jgi:hypothetical protein
VPSRNFAWSNLPPDLLKAIVRDLQLDSSNPAEAMSAEYGARPVDGFILDAWDVLRERWLAHDREALTAVVEELWQPSKRDGYRCPRRSCPWAASLYSTSW